MDKIVKYPKHADYFMFNVGYTDRLCNDESLKKIYKNVGLDEDYFDSDIEILFITYLDYIYNSADRKSRYVNKVEWNCHFEDKNNVKWTENDEAKKIYKILEEKIGNELTWTECITIKNPDSDMQIENIKYQIEDNISSCEHCGGFPSLNSEAHFYILVDGEQKCVKYYDYDTESG